MNKERFINLYERFKSSGLGINDFCANEGYLKSTFYYWKKKFLPRKVTPLLAPISITPAVKKEHSSRTVSELMTAGSTFHHPQEEKMVIEIKRPDGIEIRLSGEINPAILSTVINHLH